MWSLLLHIREVFSKIKIQRTLQNTLKQQTEWKFYKKKINYAANLYIRNVFKKTMHMTCVQYPMAYNNQCNLLLFHVIIYN